MCSITDWHIWTEDTGLVLSTSLHLNILNIQTYIQSPTLSPVNANQKCNLTTFAMLIFFVPLFCFLNIYVKYDEVWWFDSTLYELSRTYLYVMCVTVDNQSLIVQYKALPALHRCIKQSKRDTRSAAMACLRNLSIHKANEVSGY